MKILFISRSTLFQDRGGDTVQILNTARYLRLCGITVDVRISNETIDYGPYDLIHFFNIIRPADILKHVLRSGKPYVVSTIYVDYSEFDRKVRKGVTGLLFKLLPAGWLEYAKTLARAAAGGEKIVSPQYIWMGHRRSIRQIIRGAAFLLPNSQKEYERLAADLHIRHPYRVIPNAIDASLFKYEGNLVKDARLVLCVGRVEGRKNQLNLIRALEGSSFQLLIIGAPAVNQPDYYKECLDRAGENVRFIQALPQEQLIDYYAKAKVHVLPSWFETTGLSSLEAAAMGCNVVITDKGDAGEYFEDMAFYCDPGDVASIRKAVEEASVAPASLALERKIREQYTWQVTAAKTLEVYKEVLFKA